MNTAVLEKFVERGTSAQNAVNSAIAEVTPRKRETVDVPVNMIVRSRTNRVPVVDEAFLESIRKAGGVMQNITLRPIKATTAHVTVQDGTRSTPSFVIGDEIYELVSGERRWLASKKLGYSTIPAVVKDLTDTQALELQISENKDRQDLNDMEKSRQYNLLAEQYIADARTAGNTKYAFKDAVTDISNRYTESHRTVYETLQLKKLTPGCKLRLEQERITRSHAVKLCGRSEEEQDKLMLWLEREALHSNGDLPSVRRLQREIELLDQQNEAKKKQSQMFPDPAEKVAGGEAPSAPGANVSAGKGGSGATTAAPAPVAAQTSAPIGKVTFDGKTIELLPGPLPASIISELSRREPEIVRGEIDPRLTRTPVKLFNGYGGYTINTVADLQKMLTAPIPKPAPAPKPLSAAAQKKLQQQAEKQQALAERRRRKELRDQKIEMKYDVKLFTSLVSKLGLSHRTLTRVIPPLLMEFHDDGDFNPGMFAPQVLGWPAPKDPDYKGDYDYQEIRTYAKKHTKKFTPGLLAALLLYHRTAPSEIERLARYFKIDPKKLRKKAAEEVEADRLRVPEPKPGKDKRLFDFIKGDSKEWAKLRAKGATNEQIRARLSHYFGEYQSSGGPGLMWFTCKGGSNPRVWFAITDSGKPDLQGAELIGKVRELLNIESA